MTGDPKPFVMEAGGEAKRFAPATERNRDAITQILQGVLPDNGTVLEIASGTGEHIVHFAKAFTRLTWQPSDYDPVGLASIAAWVAEAGLANILPPLRIDAMAGEWPVAQADAMLCINMVHIAPWEAAVGVFTHAGHILPAGAPLVFYGPYIEMDVKTAESNLAFDTSLKARNARWGLRTVAAMVSLGSQHGLTLEQRMSMPANNLSLVFRKITA